MNLATLAYISGWLAVAASALGVLTALVVLVNFVKSKKEGK